MTKALKGKIAAFVKSETDAAILEHLTRNEVIPPDGYSPAAAIRGAMYHWVMVPFGCSYVMLQLRCPNAGDIPTEISVLEVFADKKKKLTKEDIYSYLNIQEKLCKSVMHNPTFKEVEEYLGINDRLVQERRDELHELHELVKNDKTLMAKFGARIELLELNLAYILPQNTMAFLTEWALCVDKSDVKKLSAEKLLDSAYLAKMNNNEPADNIVGVFTTSQKIEINKAAWILYCDKEKDSKR